MYKTSKLICVFLDSSLADKSPVWTKVSEDFRRENNLQFSNHSTGKYQVRQLRITLTNLNPDHTKLSNENTICFQNKIKMVTELIFYLYLHKPLGYTV